MRSLISGIALILGVVAFLAGLFFLGFAVATPFMYRSTELNAIQATQLYSMTTYYGVVAIACFALAGLCAVATRPAIQMSEDQQEAAERWRQQKESQGWQVGR